VRKIYNSNRFFEENMALLAVESRWWQIKSHLPPIVDLVRLRLTALLRSSVGRIGEPCYVGAPWLHSRPFGKVMLPGVSIRIGKGHWYLPSNRIIKLKALLEDSQF
jgi:hypothetical protein